MDYQVTITVTRTHTLTLPSSRWAALADGVWMTYPDRGGFG